MSKRVFMVMPFGDGIATQAYDCCVKKVCDEFDLSVRRADEIFTTNPIYDDILKEIQEAAVIIVDISGKNPNVFYELGVAHTLKQKQTIMITHDAHDAAPFDISHFRIIQYENSMKGTKRFEDQLRKTVEILLQDLRTLHRAEFELILSVLENNDKSSDLFSLIGLAKHPGIVKRFEPLSSEGHSPRNQNAKHATTVEHGLAAFIKMGYAETRGDALIVTELGHAFVSVLEEHDFVCDMFNGHVFTEGFVPFPERMRTRDKPQA